jgi:MFS transporter, DHA1 family, multidrug resistance protein
VFLAMVMALTALGVDLILPVFDAVREEFGFASNSTRPARLITVYFLGMALPQVVWGPLSDRFGRRPVLGAAFAVYAIGTIGSALAPSFGLMLVARLVWGIGAAGTRVTVVATIRDMYEGEAMARFMSIMMGLFLLVPVFAPGIGELALLVVPWRGLFWLTLAMLFVVVVWAKRLPETLDPANRLPLEWRSVSRAFRQVLTTPVTAAYTAATVFMQMAFASYLASSELVIDSVFGRDQQFAVIFGAVAVGLAAASLAMSRVVTRVGGEQVIRVGFLASTAVSTALFVIALVGGGSPEFWVFFPVLTVQMMLHVALMPTLNAMALVPLGAIAGTAAAVTGALRVALGGVGGAVIDSFVRDSVTPWAIGFLLGSVASLIAVLAVQTPRGEITTSLAAEQGE